MLPASVRGHRDFRRLWTGLAISQLGSAVGMVAIPVIAVELLDASAWQLSVLVALSASTAVALAFWTGTAVEFRTKRPILIAADLARAVSLLSIPIAALLDSLIFAQLCVVAVVNATCQLAFTSAAQAHLKALVSPDRLVDANSRLESTLWLSVSVGPSAGGALVGVLSAVGTVVVDALSFVLSALAVRRLRSPEPPPPRRDPTASRGAQLTAGLTFVRAHSDLRRMLVSWVIFAGAVMMASPLTMLFYLRELDFTPWQYGLLLGVPSLGGFFGARLTRRAVARFGPLRTLRWASLLRGPWQFLIPLAMPGTVGLLLCGLATFGVLFFAGMANSAMNSYRQLHTPDHLMSRVATLWSFATTAAQPVFILAGGLLATVLSTRSTLVLAAALMLGSALLLPSARATSV